jgi:hypothetical protein
MKFLCWLFGHKFKEYPPLKYWQPGVGAVPVSKSGPMFCKRCGVGLIEAMV